ncbi:Uma2 family endonuclease [Gloeobacter kilaueensis]|uniref:Cell envelope integrity inner membrane protein TolA n=1 Tax=Gloeobacter kilaueensis (strain ATCC BAA-2537 / CCAP 1431/1 / ULC 316 / JS1) TaxID=1183438 RepID=U5QM07_GLOK1|nr:Uma2 family endonuclease [Gloeobacter kilaueensis]AGY60017.1 cell envelope integrity inner membrane protein TolA [Gloeobacter kilaueensis JS1]
MTSYEPVFTPVPVPPLPSMYDLPSESAAEPGLPDEFHYWQPQLLIQTFRPPAYPLDRVFAAADLNLYYDSLHTRRYKRPDWFGVVDVPRLVDVGRLSYVIWREGRAPMVVVELLSPSTVEEDQGETLRGGEPPSKWEVYESILRVPYYVLFDRMGNSYRRFRLEGASYQELPDYQELWIEELQLGLGLWQGKFADVERLWLRWYDRQRNWIATDVEREQEATERERLRAEQERLRAEQERLRAEQERLRAEQERLRAEQAEQKVRSLSERLRELGIEPDAP